MKRPRELSILGMASYLPKRVVTADEMDRLMNAPSGTSLRMVGIAKRHFVEGDETSSQMGAKVILEALESLDDPSPVSLDAVVSVSATTQQPIPCHAALIAHELGLREGVAAFDVNATCLGFIMGMDLLASQIAWEERFKRVALVASEVASVGLNFQQRESAALFGDGAAAVVIAAQGGHRCRILATHFETYPEGIHYCQIQGGGTARHARHHQSETAHRYLFDMNGQGLYKLVSRRMPAFLDHLLSPAGLTLDDMDLLIPHQASLSALKLQQRRLGLSDERILIHVEERGNLIAASLPMGLYAAFQSGRINIGDKVLLLGTSAGVSMGGMVLEFL